MAEVTFRPRAYCKMLMHAAKYPHCAVNGVLLGRLDQEEGGPTRLILVDAVPLFHICLHVSPMAEIALTQIDQAAASEKLTVAGYYIANENISDTNIERAANRIADKIVENFPSACFVVVDNKNLTLSMETPGVILSQFCDGKWRQKDSRFDNEMLDTTAALLEQRAFKALVDFDNHLDDVSQDWRNTELNELVEELSGSS